MRFKKILVFGILALFLLQGCAQTDAIYDSVKSFEATDEELQMLVDGNLAMEIEGVSADGVSVEGGIGGYFKNLGYNIFRSISLAMKHYWIYAIGVSLLIGFIIIRLAPNAIKVRRVGWFVFIIGIPVLILILFFGSAFAADALM